MTLKVYEYSKCGTCRKALKYLDAKGIAYERISIRETPPSEAEIKSMIGAYDGAIKRLFNTSGQTYRSMQLKDSLPALSESETIALLRSNGNLIKRPFVIGRNLAIVGFKEDDWDHKIQT